MYNLLSAIQFLTILPVGKPGLFKPDKMIPFFPIVGIIAGLMLAVFDQIALLIWTPPVVAVLDVIFLVIITGAFHIDGLGDAADGLLGHRSKESALAIMKDSRIGVMGLVAILCVLAMKTCGILEINVQKSLLLVIIPAYARAGTLFGIKFLKYGRSQGGTAHALFGTRLKISDFWGLLVPIILSLFLGLRGIRLIIIFFFLTFIILLYYHKRMGCITGDMLGAITEIEEALLFLLFSVGGM